MSKTIRNETPVDRAAKILAMRNAKRNDKRVAMPQGPITATAAQSTKRKGKRASQLSGKEGAQRALIATPEEIATPATPVVATAGRKTLLATQTPEATKAQIVELLNDLRDATDAGEKKRIRRALRLRGHRGGLSHERVAVAVATPAK